MSWWKYRLFLYDQGERRRVARGARRCRGGRVADRDRAHRVPAVRQVQDVGGQVIASRTPGAGAAVSAPTGVIDSAGTDACKRTHHSWK
jgi:hypothetical protein